VSGRVTWIQFFETDIVDEDVERMTNRDGFCRRTDRPKAKATFIFSRSLDPQTNVDGWFCENCVTTAAGAQMSIPIFLRQRQMRAEMA